MSFRETLRREIEVALSKHSQSIGFRIVKYLLLGAILFFFWGTRTLWIILIILFVFSLTLHFWYRYKSRRWTKDYGMWRYHESKKIH